MKPLRLLVLLVSLPLLLGGCGEKATVEPVALPNPTEGAPVKPNLKYEIKGDAVTITSCEEGASGKLVIPATIEGKTVTSIGDRAFDNCSSLFLIAVQTSWKNLCVVSYENVVFVKKINDILEHLMLEFSRLSIDDHQAAIFSIIKRVSRNLLFR